MKNFDYTQFGLSEHAVTVAQQLIWRQDLYNVCAEYIARARSATSYREECNLRIQYAEIRFLYEARELSKFERDYGKYYNMQLDNYIVAFNTLLVARDVLADYLETGRIPAPIPVC